MICINYRPISLLSIYSKIFEKLIYSRMYYFLNKNNLIYEKQFGFRAKHSVNHALISTTELIKDKLEHGNFVAGIFIDLEKAFDTVNHEILIEKLAYYGFRGEIWCNTVKDKVCRRSLCNISLSVAEFYSFNMAKHHGMILANIFLKNHCANSTQRSGKEPVLKIIKLS